MENAQTLAYTRVRLNSTQSKVLRLCAQGVSVATLAMQLQVSQSAAKAYRHDLCQKLDVTTILGAVAKALQIGLLE